MKRLIVALLLAASLASAATTTVSGTVTDANGTAATGRVLISWPSFIAVGGALVPAGSKSVNFTAGALSVALEPNVGATPSGTSYTLRFSGATMNATEYWVVPNTGTATIATVRTSIPPNPSATISLAALSLSGAAEGYVLKIVSGTPAWAAAGGGGAGDAYSFVSDGTTTPAASGADTLKFRSASNLLSIAAGSNDPTHGDNLLFTVNAGNLSLTESQISDLAHFSGVYGDLTSIPSTFAPAAHVLNSATHTVSGLTTGQLLQATGATSFGFANIAQAQVTAHQAALAIAWAQLTGVPSTFAPSAHALTGADHTASGLTTGHVLSATGATTFGFGALAASQIPALDTAKITTGTFADARISESSVTQHEAALSITESQISDLAHTTDTTKTIQDEGTPLTQRATLNFVGAGVGCTDDSGNSRTTCTISGGGGGGGDVTVEEADGTPSVGSVSVIQFDSADGFSVTDETGGQVQIDFTAPAETNDLEGDGAAGIADTEIPIGTGAGTVTYAPLSGDATMSNAGVVTVANDSHAHTGSTLSGIDISDDTNLTTDGEGVERTGDSIGLELDGSTLTKGASGVRVSASYNAPTATALAANPASLTDQFCIDRNADGSCATAGDLDDLQGTIATAQIENDAVQLGKLDDGSDTPSAGQVLVVATDTTEVEYVAQSTIAAGTAAALTNNPASTGANYCADRNADGSCATQNDLDDLGGTIATAQIEDAAVTVEKSENDLKTYHDCQTLVDFGTAIPDTADIPSMWGEFPFAMTLTKVWCETDANTATISLQRDDGTPASMLSANLVCDTNEQDSCASGCDVNTIDGAEDDVAAGQQIDFVIVSIGTVNRINVCVTGIIQ